MEPSLVQILVVVANIQVGTLKAEGEKGSMRTSIGHGLAGPERQANAVVKGSIVHMKCCGPLNSKGNRDQDSRAQEPIRRGRSFERVVPHAATRTSQETPAGEPGRDLLSS